MVRAEIQTQAVLSKPIYFGAKASKETRPEKRIFRSRFDLLPVAVRVAVSLINTWLFLHLHILKFYSRYSILNFIRIIVSRSVEPTTFKVCYSPHLLSAASYRLENARRSRTSACLNQGLFLVLNFPAR